MNRSILGKIGKKVFTGFSQQAIPALDGPLKPNSRLDRCPEIGGETKEPEDVALGEDGSLYVSSTNKVLRLSGETYSVSETIAEFDGLVTGLTCLPSGGLGVCVNGAGVFFVNGERNGKAVTSSEGEPIKCPLSIAATTDGTLYVTDGSRQFGSDKWVYDLMAKGSSGRLIRIDKRNADGQTMLDNLCWPFGLALDRNDRSLFFTESWQHSVTRIPLTNTNELRPEKRLNNLPGYPARIIPAGKTGYWLSLFALRTQLVEFVLNENRFRKEMMRTIDSTFWIAPSMKTTDHVLEPLQQAGIKSWGMKKAWAPPRSYGLILRLDAELKPLTSFHSRNDGIRHGITGLTSIEGGVLATSKGCDRLLMLSEGEIA